MRERTIWKVEMIWILAIRPLSSLLRDWLIGRVDTEGIRGV